MDGITLTNIVDVIKYKKSRYKGRLLGLAKIGPVSKACYFYRALIAHLCVGRWLLISFAHHVQADQGYRVMFT